MLGARDRTGTRPSLPRGRKVVLSAMGFGPLATLPVALLDGGSFAMPDPALALTDFDAPFLGAGVVLAEATPFAGFFSDVFFAVFVLVFAAGAGAS